MVRQLPVLTRDDETDDPVNCRAVLTPMVYKPTDRERQRYVVCTGDPTPVFKRLFGEHGVARAGLQRRGGIFGGVLRVNADSVERVRAAASLTCGCKTLLVTSSLTKARTVKP